LEKIKEFVATMEPTFRSPQTKRAPLRDISNASSEEAPQSPLKKSRGLSKATPRKMKHSLTDKENEGFVIFDSASQETIPLIDRNGSLVDNTQTTEHVSLEIRHGNNSSLDNCTRVFIDTFPVPAAVPVLEVLSDDNDDDKQLLPEAHETAEIMSLDESFLDRVKNGGVPPASQSFDPSIVESSSNMFDEFGEDATEILIECLSQPCQPNEVAESMSLGIQQHSNAVCVVESTGSEQMIGESFLDRVKNGGVPPASQSFDPSIAESSSNMFDEFGEDATEILIECLSQPCQPNEVAGVVESTVMFHNPLTLTDRAIPCAYGSTDVAIELLNSTERVNIFFSNCNGGNVIPENSQTVSARFLVNHAPATPLSNYSEFDGSKSECGPDDNPSTAGNSSNGQSEETETNDQELVFKELLLFLNEKEFDNPNELIDALEVGVQEGKLNFIAIDWLESLRNSFGTVLQTKITLATLEDAVRDGNFKEFISSSLPNIGKKKTQTLRAFRMIYCSCILIGYDWVHGNLVGRAPVNPHFKKIVQPFCRVPKQVKWLQTSYHYMEIAKQYICLQSYKNVIGDLAQFILFRGKVTARGTNNSKFIKVLICICNYHYGGNHFGVDEDRLDLNFDALKGQSL
jgi:hypothetical protein